MSELTVQEAALAWAQGKMVEAKHKTLLCGEWTIVEPAGKECFHTYSAGIFGDCAHKYQFRLAPVPTAKEWRPWTAEEVPVGGQVRYKNNKQSIRMLIVSNVQPYFLGEKSFWTLEELFCLMQHSIDGGKTWLPCGVEVTE